MSGVILITDRSHTAGYTLQLILHHQSKRNQMKTKLLLTKALLFLFACSVRAQVIPNYNFENWSNGANSAPDGWLTHGSQQAGFYPATQTTDNYLGTYALRLENKITLTDTTGGSVSTIRPNGREGFGPAFPVATRYNNLKGFYKYAPLNGDSAELVVFITKTGYSNSQGWSDLLAWGQKHLGAASTYTPFSVGYMDALSGFYYDSNTEVPDSAYIEIGSYKFVGTAPGVETKPLGNSVLYMDALNFDTYITGIDERLNITTGFKLFPTMNDGDFKVSFGTLKSDFTTIKVYDLNGREVKNLLSENLNEGQHTFHYDLKNMNSGSYLLVIATGEGYKAERFYIQK